MIQQTTQISPVDASKLVEKCENIFAEGFAQITVIKLDTDTYGLNATKPASEE
jgi:hypothetical protein